MENSSHYHTVSSDPSESVNYEGQVSLQERKAIPQNKTWTSPLYRMVMNEGKNYDEKNYNEDIMWMDSHNCFEFSGTSRLYYNEK